MKSFLCTECNKPLIITKGNFLFSYNIKCSSKHNSENIDVDELLSRYKKIDKNFFICEIHKKYKNIHCFECNEDLCFYCFKKLHKNHKIEYLNILNYNESEKNDFEYQLKREYKFMINFLSELYYFQNQLNTYINELKSKLTKYHEFRRNLLLNIFQKEKYYSYIDITNVKTLFYNEEYKLINNNMKNFIKIEKFNEKYDFLRNLFDLINKKGKYIENINIKDIFLKLLNKNIIPFNKDYFIELDTNKFIVYKKDYEAKNFFSIFEKNFKFKILDIIIKKYDNKENGLSFYMLEEVEEFPLKIELFDVKLEFLSNEKTFTKNKIKLFNSPFNLLALSKNKNIININNKLVLYDNLFNNEKLIGTNTNDFYQSLNLDENTFLYSTNKYQIYIYQLDENNRINKKIIQKCCKEIIYYSEKKKILFSKYLNYIYIINFNIEQPEIVQAIDNRYLNEESNYFDYSIIYNINYNNIIKVLDFYKDDRIYLLKIKTIFKDISNNDDNITYLAQYKMIDKEFKEMQINDNKQI